MPSPGHKSGGVFAPRKQGRLLADPLKKCAIGFASVETSTTRRHWQSQWHPKSPTKPFFQRAVAWAVRRGCVRTLGNDPLPVNGYPKVLAAFLLMADLLVQNITKEFPTRSGPLVVLRGISFQLQGGESLAIVGPSGSGKSTLLHILGTLEPPTSGRVILDGVEPADLDPVRLATFRNQKIGFVFQDASLLPQCTVLENVLVPTLARGAASKEAVERAKDLLDRVGLSDRLAHRPGELSGGQRQRVALARALVNRPLLLLADEPTGNLDRTTAEQISELLLELHRQEMMILIVVTHSLRLARRVQQVRQLDQGLLQELTEE